MFCAGMRHTKVIRATAVDATVLTVAVDRMKVPVNNDYRSARQV